MPSAQRSSEGLRSIGFSGAIALVAVLAGGALILAPVILAPMIGGVRDPAVSAGGLVVMSVGLWSTGRLPEFLPAVILFFLATALAIAPPEVVFSGFRSAAVWLVFSGMVIGAAVQKTGLGRRAVRLALRRAPGHYFGFVCVIALAGFLLAWFIPSAMGRTMLYIPLAAAAAERMGLHASDRGYAGVILAAAMGTMVPAFSILPANVPNMAMAGAAENIYGYTFGYASYLALNFPVLGLLGLVSTPVLAWAFFAQPLAPAAPETDPGPVGAAERRFFVILLITLALWASDAWHGISPAWVGLGAAVACLVPGLGVLSSREFIASANFGPWIYVAGVIGMGSIAAQSGLGAAVGEALLSTLNLQAGNDAGNYAALTGISAVVSMLATNTAAPAIVTPMAAALADSTGWSLDSVLMTQVASWTAFPFVYQAPPVMVGLALAGVPLRRVIPAFLAYFVFGIAVLWPLHFLWGRLLGYFG